VRPLLPPSGTYPFTDAVPPIVAPDGEPLAQLTTIPPSLGTSLGVAFPPFGRRPRREPSYRLPPEERVAYRFIGLVRYSGPEGSVIVHTVQPSEAALRHHLSLGNPAGALPDGTPVFTIAVGETHMRWMAEGCIIGLVGQLSQSRLLELAADITLA
jgi:hypothetical protein